MAQQEIPSTITLNGVSVDWETAKKGLDKVLWQTAKSVEDFVPKFFKKGDFKQKMLKRKAYSGIPEAQLWGPGGAAGVIIPAQGIEYLWDIIATHFWYGNAVVYDIESKTFDEYNMIPKLPIELGKSMTTKRQKLVSSFFLNGFSQNGPDGVPFFSQYHPMDTRLGGVQGNVIPGTLSVTVLDAAINALIGLTDPLGRPMNYTPKRLFVHPTKVMSARQILGLGMERVYQGPANPSTSGIQNTNNVIRNEYQDFNIEVVSWPWIYPIDAAILQANDYETYWSDAVAMQTKMKEQDDHSTRHESWFSSAAWFDNYLGYVGITGASITAL